MLGFANLLKEHIIYLTNYETIKFFQKYRFGSNLKTNKSFCQNKYFKKIALTFECIKILK
jgi:hypothetical protein